MRYVFVSDIHGQYKKLKAALLAVDFDPLKDTLVSLGDPFDRGPENFKVLNYLMSLPNKILVWGNHDYRLMELMHGRSEVGGHDYQNGMLATIQDFAGYKSISNITDGIFRLNEFTQCENVKNMLEKYFNECVFAIEWQDLIATHAWIPVNRKYEVLERDKWGRPLKSNVTYSMIDWRQADVSTWYNATWAHTEEVMDAGLYPDKPLVVGHWHSWRLWAKQQKLDFKMLTDADLNFNIFYLENKLIGLDGCSNADIGKVNAFVYETDEEPILYKGVK